MKKRLLSKIVAIFFFLTLTFKLASAQEVKGLIPPLYKYLQNNADSTLVLTYDKDLVHPVTHFILSKYSDLVTLYLYDSPYDKRARNGIPPTIRNFFQKRNLEINRLAVDTNYFFNAKNVDLKKSKKLWKKTMAFQPWQINDDSIDGEGCPVNGDQRSVIYDGGTIRLYLITKSRIRELDFYAPRFYQEKCPGRQGRKAILGLEQLFKVYFDKTEYIF